MNLNTQTTLSPNYRYILLSAFIAGIAFPGNQLGLLSFVAYIPVLNELFKGIGIYKKRSWFFIGFILGATYSCVSMYWVGLSNFGGFIGMTLTIAVRYGICTLLFGIIVRRNQFFWCIVPLLVFQEYLTTYTELDYAWHWSAYSLTDFPLLCQIAEFTGALGLSFSIYLVNTLLFLAYKYVDQRKRYAQFLLLYSTLFLSLNITLYYTSKNTHTQAVKVGLLQPNIDPFLKWQRDYKHLSTNRLFAGTQEAISKGADHIVFPETSFPFYMRSGRYKHIRDSLRYLSDTYNATLAVGVPDYAYIQNERHVYNSVFHFFPNQTGYNTYKKQKLVPVAEKVIYPAIFDLLGDLIPGLSGWSRGHTSTVFKSPHNIYTIDEHSEHYTFSHKDSLKFATIICIESTFPNLVSEFKNNGAKWINIITNDGWFYPHWNWFKKIAHQLNFSPYLKGKGAYQHNKIAVLRAIENRITITRSANTGVSSIISPTGEILNYIDQYEQGVLVNYVPISSKPNPTLFSKYGHWFVFILLILFCIGILWQIKTFTREKKLR